MATFISLSGFLKYAACSIDVESTIDKRKHKPRHIAKRYMNTFMIKFEDIFNKTLEICLLKIKNNSAEKENEAPNMLPMLIIFKVKGIKNKIKTQKTIKIKMSLSIGLLI